MEYISFEERDDKGFPRDWCLLCHKFLEPDHMKTNMNRKRMSEGWRFSGLSKRPFTYCAPPKPVGRLGDPIRPRAPPLSDSTDTTVVATNTKKPSMSAERPPVEESLEQLGTELVEFFEEREVDHSMRPICLLCNKFSDAWHLTTDMHKNRVANPWYHKDFHLVVNHRLRGSFPMWFILPLFLDESLWQSRLNLDNSLLLRTSLRSPVPFSTTRSELTLLAMAQMSTVACAAVLLLIGMNGLKSIVDVPVIPRCSSM
eukprot:4302819-Amphidinium_carterae.3